MVDPARLDRLLSAIATEVGVLATLARHDDDELLGDHAKIRAVKYAFVVAIEAAIDAAEHVIASEELRAPASFADAFTVLQETGLLEERLARTMADAARFRNLLVHGYAEVDDRRVLKILRTRPDDLLQFRKAIAALSTSGPVSM